MITRNVAPCSQQELQNILNYDVTNGNIFWKIRRNKIAAGSRAGRVKCDGNGRVNRYIKLFGKNYKESHIVWYYITGNWPTMVIDHIDRNTENNKFENLRHVSQSENIKNRKYYERVKLQKDSKGRFIKKSP